ncbi:unnamed protein product [Neospora caninum Liverpool]|uniref:Hypothtetical protein, conserved, putative n=1 Tax=Neospora caninum (strain Liverpool) TaxID=572307 RepID=F0VFA4_NEOCL|nr:uncharacterized protein NCLIV_021870 [Neospora caninum Liverpool]CBZ52398.1 unnamed protein product [Neospora caninum Liverpool]CEL66370.1 TPA: hypothtetical protein, conserved, putative [Neospora caninum Liverpool]|eukprot:XP_003882430.1 uncharacterized protein NCLIV_021870 [Neospora caninum Liverpool]
MATDFGCDAAEEALSRFYGCAAQDPKIKDEDNVAQPLRLPCQTIELGLEALLEIAYQGTAKCTTEQPDPVTRDEPPETPGSSCRLHSTCACGVPEPQYGDRPTPCDLRHPTWASPANKGNSAVNETSASPEGSCSSTLDRATLDSARASFPVDRVRVRSLVNRSSPPRQGRSTRIQGPCSAGKQDHTSSDAMSDSSSSSADSSTRTLRDVTVGDLRNGSVAAPRGVPSGGGSFPEGNARETGGGVESEERETGSARKGAKDAPTGTGAMEVTPEGSRPAGRGSGQMQREPFLFGAQRLPPTFCQPPSLVHASNNRASTPFHDTSASLLQAESASQGNCWRHLLMGTSGELRAASNSGEAHPPDTLGTADAPVQSRAATSSATGSDRGNAAPANGPGGSQALHWPPRSHPSLLVVESMTGSPSQPARNASSRASTLRDEGHHLRLPQTSCDMISSLSACRVDLLSTRATKEELQRREQDLQQQLHNSRQEQEILQALVGEMTALRQDAEAAAAAEAADAPESREEHLGEQGNRERDTRNRCARLGVGDASSNERGTSVACSGEDAGAFLISPAGPRFGSDDIGAALLQAFGLKRRKFATLAPGGPIDVEADVESNAEAQLRGQLGAFGRQDASSVRRLVSSVLRGEEAVQAGRGKTEGPVDSGAASRGLANAVESRVRASAACDSRTDEATAQAVPPGRLSEPQSLTGIATGSPLGAGLSRLATASCGASRVPAEPLYPGCAGSPSMRGATPELERLSNVEPRSGFGNPSAEQQVLALLAASTGSAVGAMDDAVKTQLGHPQHRAAEYAKLARLLPRINRLTFSTQTLMWVVRVQTRRTRLCKSFSVRKLGFLPARQAAVDFLMEFDHQDQQLHTRPSDPTRSASPTARSRRSETDGAAAESPLMHNGHVDRDTAADGFAPMDSSCACCGGQHSDQPQLAGARLQLPEASTPHSGGPGGCVARACKETAPSEASLAHGSIPGATKGNLAPGERHPQSKPTQGDCRAEASAADPVLKGDAAHHGGAAQTVASSKRHLEEERNAENPSRAQSSAASHLESGGPALSRAAVPVCPVDSPAQRLCARCATSSSSDTPGDCGHAKPSLDSSSGGDTRRRGNPAQCLAGHGGIAQSSCGDAAGASRESVGLRELQSDACSTIPPVDCPGASEASGPGRESGVRTPRSASSASQVERRLTTKEGRASTCTCSGNEWTKPRASVDSVVLRREGRDGSFAHLHQRQEQHERRKHAREDLALRARQLPHTVGVKFDPTCPRWIAHWKREGQRFFKSFSVEKNGFENAWNLAKLCRQRNAELAAATRSSASGGTGKSRRSLSGQRNAIDGAESDVTARIASSITHAIALGGDSREDAGAVPQLPTCLPICQRQDASSVNPPNIPSDSFLAALEDYLSGSYATAVRGGRQDSREDICDRRWCRRDGTQPESVAGDAALFSAAIPARAGQTLLDESRESEAPVCPQSDRTRIEAAAVAEIAGLRAFCNLVASEAALKTSARTTSRDALRGTGGWQRGPNLSLRATDGAADVEPQWATPLRGAAAPPATESMQDPAEFVPSALFADQMSARLAGAPAVDVSWIRSTDVGADSSASESRLRLPVLPGEAKRVHSRVAYSFKGTDCDGGGTRPAGEGIAQGKEGADAACADGGSFFEGLGVPSLDCERACTASRLGGRSAVPGLPGQPASHQAVPAFMPHADDSRVAEPARTTAVDAATDLRETVSSVATPRAKGPRSDLRDSAQVRGLSERPALRNAAVCGPQLWHSEYIQDAVRLCSAMPQQRTTGEQRRLALADVGAGAELVSSSLLSGAALPPCNPQLAEHLSLAATASLTVPSVPGSGGDGSAASGEASVPLLLLLSRGEHSRLGRSAAVTSSSAAVPDPFVAEGSPLLPSRANGLDIAKNANKEGSWVNYGGLRLGTRECAAFLATPEAGARDLSLDPQASQGVASNSATTPDLWTRSPTDLVALSSQLNVPGVSLLPKASTASGFYSSELLSEEGARWTVSAQARIAGVGVQEQGGRASKLGSVSQETEYGEASPLKGAEGNSSAASPEDAFQTLTIHSARTSAGTCPDDTGVLGGLKGCASSGITGSVLGEPRRDIPIEGESSGARAESPGQVVDRKARRASEQERLREQSHAFSLSDWGFDMRLPVTENIESNMRRRNSIDPLFRELDASSAGALSATERGLRGAVVETDFERTKVHKGSGEEGRVDGVSTRRASSTCSGSQASHSLLGGSETPGWCSSEHTENPERLSWAKVAVLMILRNLRDACQTRGVPSEGALCRLTGYIQMVDACHTEGPNLRALLATFSNLIAEQRLPGSLPTEDLLQLVRDVQAALTTQGELQSSGTEQPSSVCSAAQPS